MGSLADCVLADAILTPPRTPTPPTAIMKVRGLQKSITEKHLLVNEKRRCIQMAKDFFKKYGNKECALNYLQIKVKSRCLSAPDATSLHHCLKNKQPKLICFQW